MADISVADKMIAYIAIEVGRAYSNNRDRARDLNISESNASRYVRFQSGLGVDVALKIADAKFGGSIDAMRRAAEEWWVNRGLGAVIAEMPSGRFEQEIKAAYAHAPSIKFACDLARQQGISEETIVKVATQAALNPPDEADAGYSEGLLAKMKSIESSVKVVARRPSSHPGLRRYHRR